MCTLNDTGAGGGGAGGTSAAFAGVSSFLSSNGVRSGNGTVRLCVPNTAQALTFNAQSSQNFVAGGTFSISPLATSASPNSGNPITYASTTPTVCTVTGTTVTMVSTGACTVTANQVGDTVYLTAAEVIQNITINPGIQTLSFPAQSPASQTFLASGTFPINPLATSASPNSGNPIVYSSLTASVCTVTSTTVTIVAVGTCTLAANQAGNANFAAAVQVTRDVTITPATQVITFPVSTQPTRRLVVGSTFALSPLPTGGALGNPVTLSAGPGGVCSISGTTVTMFGIGTCTITANQAGGGGFAAAAPVTQTIVFAFDEAAAIVPTLPQWLLALLAGLLGVIGWRSIRSVSMRR